MANEGNPYFQFIEEMRKQASETRRISFIIGKVKSADPLLIEAGTLQLDRSDVLISDYLLPGYEREVLIGTNTENMVILDGLKAGEQVLILISEDKQTFVIVSRLR